MKSQSLNTTVVAAVIALGIIASALFLFGNAHQVNASSPGNNYLAIGMASTTSATVTTSSTLIMATSTNPQQRQYAVFTNDSGGNTVYLSLGLPAVANTGIRLAPGASYTINVNNLFSGAVYGIGTTSVVVDVEGFQ